jgi:hypothetical protein
MFAQADRAKVVLAPESKPVGRERHRLDPVNDLLEQASLAFVRRSLELHLDQREDGLVIVPDPVVDLVPGILEKLEPPLTLGDPAVNLTLVEYDHQKHEDLGERCRDQPPCPLGVWDDEAPAIFYDDVPGQQLTEDERD